MSTASGEVESHRLSMAMENYLLSIARLGERGVKVTVAQLAEHFKVLPSAEGLGTSLPSLSSMIGRMRREELVIITRDKEISLTDLGGYCAASILRRHRLAERLVVDMLGVELRLAHQEAHRLEHAISPYLEDKILEVLDHPTTCPFGHPIPGSSYVAPSGMLTLDCAEMHIPYVIERVPEDDQDLLEYFVDNDFLPDRSVIVKESSKSRGIITLECSGNELVFGYDISILIWLRPK